MTPGAVGAIRPDDEVERGDVDDRRGHLPAAPPVPGDVNVARRVDRATWCLVARGVVLRELEQGLRSSVGEYHPRGAHRGCRQTYSSGAAAKLEHGRSVEAQRIRVRLDPSRENRAGAPYLPAGAVAAAPARSLEVQPDGRRGSSSGDVSAPGTRWAHEGGPATTRRDERRGRDTGYVRGARGPAHLGRPDPLVLYSSVAATIRWRR